MREMRVSQSGRLLEDNIEWSIDEGQNENGVREQINRQQTCREIVTIMNMKELQNKQNQIMERGR